jgi:hypothetical protein
VRGALAAALPVGVGAAIEASVPPPLQSKDAVAAALGRRPATLDVRPVARISWFGELVGQVDWA